MERENIKKRGREGEEKREADVCNTKKQELSYIDDFDHSFREISDGRLCNEFGVFDFPWLKEGVICKGDECFGLEDNAFAPSSYLNETTPTTSTTDADQFFVQNVCQTVPALSNSFRDEEKFEDNLWSFQFDELDTLDCKYWSSVFDQPLDVTLNKV